MTNGQMYLHELLGRKVRDANGKTVGHVFDVVAERDGDDLRVTKLLVGPRAWLSRLSWRHDPEGREIHWEEIADLEGDIQLRGRKEEY